MVREVNTGDEDFADDLFNVSSGIELVFMEVYTDADDGHLSLDSEQARRLATDLIKHAVKIDKRPLTWTDGVSTIEFTPEGIMSSEVNLDG